MTELLLQSRKNFVKLISAYSLEKLNHIPQGFNNNLIWNFGHVLVTQQLLCYKLSGVAMNIDDDTVNRYKKGTEPEQDATKDEVEMLKHFAISSVNRFEVDLQADRFSHYTPYETSYGFTLNNINDAIAFNLAHENMHLGYAMALRKVLG